MRIQIDTGIWDSMILESSTPEARLVYLFVITAPQNNVLGIFQLSEKRMAIHTGLAIASVKTALKSLTEHDGFFYENGVIIIPEKLLTSKLNPNQKVAAIRLFKTLPVQTMQDILNDKFDQFLKMKEKDQRTFEVMYFAITGFKGKAKKPVKKPEPPAEKKVYKYADFTKKMAQWFPEKLQPKTVAQKEDWHDISRLLIERDKYTESQITEAVKFGRSDDFWRKTFLSYAKLRKANSDGIKFIDVFLEKMDKNYEPSKTLKQPRKKKTNQF